MYSTKRSWSDTQKETHALNSINRFLLQHGKELKDYCLPGILIKIM